MGFIAANQLTNGLGLDKLIDHTGAAVRFYDVVGYGGGDAHDKCLLCQSFFQLDLFLFHAGIIQLDDGLVIQAENFAAGAGADFVAAFYRQLPHGTGDVHDFRKTGDIKNIHHLVTDIDNTKRLGLTALLSTQQHPQPGGGDKLQPIGINQHAVRTRGLTCQCGFKLLRIAGVDAAE